MMSRASFNFETLTMSKPSAAPPAKRRLFPKITGAMFPFTILTLLTLVTSLGFYLLQIYGTAPVNMPFAQSFGSCVDAGQNASFFTAFYFVSNVYTAIGYGNVIPCTWPGKLLTIVASLTGIPATLLCLTRIGKWTLVYLDKACERIARLKGREEQEAKSRKMRFGLAFSLTMLWVVLSSFYFQHFFSLPNHQEWSFFDALYFTIVTLFTIGFGDFYPQGDYGPIIAFLLFLLIGLSLVSMCVTAVTQRIENDFERLLALLESYGEGNSKNSIGISGQEAAKVARIVLDLCRSDPTGKWLEPIMATKAAKRWKRKALKKDIGVQTAFDKLAPDSHHPFAAV